MSLLLDALKKSGHYQNVAEEGAGNGTQKPSGLTLEEITPASTPQPKPAHSRIEPTRAAGENLFASKKAVPAKGKMKLGIVPIAVIGGIVFGSGYGYYVWREITPRPVASRIAPPPQPSVQQQPSSPPAAFNTVPPAPATQTAVLPAEPVPTEKNTVVTPSRPAHKRTQAFQIEKKQEVDSITPLLEAAYAAYRTGDYETAWQDYKKVLQRDSHNRDALLGMAAVAQQQGQDAVAAEYYGHLLALDPRDPLAQAGMSSLNKESLPSKETRLKLLLDQQPQSAALHFALGNLYAEQSRWAESQQAYFDAYSLQPDAAQYAFNLAISLDHLGQTKQAAQYYQRALQLDSSGSATFDHAQAQHRLDELKAP